MTAAAPRSFPAPGDALTPRRAGLMRLLQLASPALPIGAYSYSQGLEWAVEARIIRDAASASAWIGDVLDHAIATCEAALLARALDAHRRADATAFIATNAWFRASRETRELRAETEQMGGSLVSLARDLGWLDAAALALVERCSPITLPAAFALAAGGAGMPDDDVISAYVWSWLENQVLAAIKTVPLGQVAGQRMLSSLAARIPGIVGRAMAIDDDDVASFVPGLALASALHETQYSRLFRS